jgi:hypothetical protein
MHIPVVRGIIDRRILVNYRVDPDVLTRVLPPPFRPHQVNGHGIAGICLIRLKQIRPWFLPKIVGISSENAAHRIAVEWEQDGERHDGVFVPRRDTCSRLNTLAGGRLFPGVHHHARFQINEQNGRFSVQMNSDDGDVQVTVQGRLASALPETSIFRSTDEASQFFNRGSLGYSVAARPKEFDGLELRTFNWRADPLSIEKVCSSYFENDDAFPKGSVEFDCALLMQGIRHEWHGRPSICCGREAVQTSVRDHAGQPDASVRSADRRRATEPQKCLSHPTAKS